MDKKLFRKWFNGKYGKLPYDRQLKEIEKLRVLLDDFEESRRRKFERHHEVCTCCGKYSLRTMFGKRVSIETYPVDVHGEKQNAEFSVEFYTCPKCGKEYEYDKYFIGYTSQGK